MSILDSDKLKCWFDNIKDFVPYSDRVQIPFDVIDKYKSYRFSNMNLPIVKMGFNDYRLVLTKSTNKNQLIEEMSTKNYIKTIDEDFNIIYELIYTVESVYYSGKDYLHTGVESRIKEGLSLLCDDRSYDDKMELILFGKQLEYGKNHHTNYYDVLEDNLKQLKDFKSLQDTKNEIDLERQLLNNRLSGHRNSGLSSSSVFSNYNRS